MGYYFTKKVWYIILQLYFILYTLVCHQSSSKYIAMKFFLNVMKHTLKGINMEVNYNIHDMFVFAWHVFMWV